MIGYVLIFLGFVLMGFNLTMAVGKVVRWPAKRTAVIGAVALVVTAAGALIL